MVIIIFMSFASALLVVSNAIFDSTEKGVQQSTLLKTSAINNALEIIEKLGEKDAEEFLRLLKS